jgi:hypothetical protein
MTSAIFSDAMPCSRVILILRSGGTYIFRFEDKVKQKTKKEHTCLTFNGLYCVTSQKIDFLFPIFCVGYCLLATAKISQF